MQNKVYDNILSSDHVGGVQHYLLAPRNINDFFTTGQYLLRIPNYQRPYSWEKSNILDLLNDILKVSRGETISWFLGPIFTVRTSSNDQYCDLLDGQQRITTIQIILREASLILLEEEGIDLSEYKDLKKKIDKVLRMITNCLIKQISLQEEIPRFQTEESLNDIFQTYILEFNEIENHGQLKNKRKEFKSQIEKARKEGSITAGTFGKAIDIVQHFFKEQIFKDASPQGFEHMFNFIDALLSKCWLIEIPLKQHSESIQIFESLNNRGKSLTLVDKLRYKSIVATSKENLNVIRNKWKTVYSALNFHNDEKYFKNEDDFFKVFFNSIRGDDFTREGQFMEIFSEIFLKSDKTINRFLDETIQIANFYRILSTSLNLKNEFITENFDKKEHQKVSALLQLVKKMLNISDNSRFVFFYILREFKSYSVDKHMIVQSLWSLVRRVFYFEIAKNQDSNKIRTAYLDYIKKLNNKESYITESKPLTDSFDFNGALYNIIRTTSNPEAIFILYLYAYLNDFEVLTAHNPKQYKYEQLEHFIPTAWKNNWSDSIHTRTQAINFIKSLSTDSPELFKHLDPELFMNLIKNSENFELLDYKSKAKRNEDCIIEYLGNKWILHSGTNARANNGNFNQKKSLYQDDKWIKIPSNNDTCGINSYDTLTYQEVIIRSLKLSNGIIDNIKNQWDNI